LLKINQRLFPCIFNWGKYKKIPPISAANLLHCGDINFLKAFLPENSDTPVSDRVINGVNSILTYSHTVCNIMCNNSFTGNNAALPYQSVSWDGTTPITSIKISSTGVLVVNNVAAKLVNPLNDKIPNKRTSAPNLQTLTNIPIPAPLPKNQITVNNVNQKSYQQDSNYNDNQQGNQDHQQGQQGHQQGQFGQQGHQQGQPGQPGQQGHQEGQPGQQGHQEGQPGQQGHQQGQQGHQQGQPGQQGHQQGQQGQFGQQGHQEANQGQPGKGITTGQNNGFSQTRTGDPTQTGHTAPVPVPVPRGQIGGTSQNARPSAPGIGRER